MWLAAYVLKGKVKPVFQRHLKKLKDMITTMTAQKQWPSFVTKACVCSYIELLFSDSAC